MATLAVGVTVKYDNAECWEVNGRHGPGMGGGP